MKLKINTYCLLSMAESLSTFQKEREHVNREVWSFCDELTAAAAAVCHITLVIGWRSLAQANVRAKPAPLKCNGAKEAADGAACVVCLQTDTKCTSELRRVAKNK